MIGSQGQLIPSEAAMAEIQPFRAYRYDTKKNKLENVLTQPYDKISPAMQDKYYAASPDNLIIIEKGRSFPGDTAENNVYTRAGAKVDEWIQSKTLVQDAAPAITIYSQEYLVPHTHTKKTRLGFIALGAWRITTREWCSGTNTRYRGRRRTASSC